MQIVVPAGQIHKLVGPNGCGKSLLLDAATGVGPATGLQVSLGATPLGLSGPTARWRHGLRRMFQSPLIPGEVTPRQALQHAQAQGKTDSQVLRGVPGLLQGAGVPADQPVGTLSFGQRRLVELCIALQARHATLLDEPFAGIAPALLPASAALVHAAAADGLAVLVVDHIQQAAGLDYAREHVWVAARDALVPGAEETDLRAVFSRCAADWQDPLGARWDVRGLHLADRAALEGCTVQLDAGQFIAVSGGNGSGKSTLLRALAGVEQPWVGVRADVQARGDASRVHLSPQPPKLLPELRVGDNLRCMLFTGKAAARDAVRVDCARQLVAHLGLPVDPLWRRWAADLSGGEAAMVALVGAVCCPHPVLLLDEPFEGLSVQALPRAQQLLAAALRAGKCAIITTHDPRLLQRTGDVARIALERPALAASRITGRGPDALMTTGEPM